MTSDERNRAAGQVTGKNNRGRAIASAARSDSGLRLDDVLDDAIIPITRKRRLLHVRAKYFLTLGIAVIWASLSYLLAVRWISDLSSVLGWPLAYMVVFTIAIIPGFMNAFIVTGLLFDRRPKRAALSTHPGISILVAAYNEEASILGTLESIERQNYPGPLQVFVINDGSTDRTMEKLRSVSYPWLQVIDMKVNGGKATALNVGLEQVSFSLTITLDGDFYLYKNALTHIVGRYLSDPPNTAAVAGTVLVRNSRLNIITKIQEWDYFHGIAAIKRLQSLFQGTLVAQGAFSIYRTNVLREVGGWTDCVGEDIVLTWAMLKKGYRVGYCEDSFVFTNVPTTFRQFIRQRQRWSRGLVEAFRSHSGLLFRKRMSTLFIWWNLLFPVMDLAYTVFFVPGLLLAVFGIFWIAGPMTLLVLPLAMLLNYLMFLISGVHVRGTGPEGKKEPGRIHMLRTALRTGSAACLRCRIHDGSAGFAEKLGHEIVPVLLAGMLIFAFASPAVAQDYQNPTVTSEIRAGRTALEDGHPDQARDRFATALKLSGTSDNDRFVAWIGLGRADLWLENYSAAAADFREAQGLAHDAPDRQAADIGLSKALNAMEYYLQAHALAAPYAAGQIEPTIEVLRADQALGWDDRSIPTLGAAPPVGPGDRLGADYLRLKAETDYRLSNRVDGTFSYNHDSDNLTVYGYELGAWLPGSTGGDTFNNWRLSAKTYTVDDGTTSDQVTYFGAGTSMRIGDAHHLNANAGVGTLGGWTYFQGSADWAFTLSDSFAINASAGREPILTTTSLADHILFNTYTVGASVRPADHFYVIPTYFHQDFSDGNRRDGASLRLVLSPYDIPDSSTAIGAQMYARLFSASAPSAGIYFNPGHYDLVKLDLIAVHRFNPDWLLRGTAGGGYQSIDGSSGGSYEFELTLSGRLPGNGRLDATIGRSSFASVSSGGSEYWNNTFMLTIGYPLR